jgi:hypothetical protein
MKFFWRDTRNIFIPSIKSEFFIFFQFKMKTQNLSLKSIAVEKIVNVVSDSTAHGIKNVFKSTNWFVKIFWIVMFLTSSCVAIYCKFA